MMIFGARPNLEGTHSLKKLYVAEKAHLSITFEELSYPEKMLRVLAKNRMITDKSNANDLHRVIRSSEFKNAKQ